MSNPKLAARSCADCKKWVYNEQTGDVETRGGLPILRGNAATPCRTCPKESPEKAKSHELSAKNYRALSAYLRSYAVGFRNLTPREAADRVLQENFSIISQVIETVRSMKQGRNLATTFASLFSAPDKRTRK